MILTGIWNLADDMGTYSEHIQNWLTKTQEDLEERNLTHKFDNIMGLTDLFGNATFDTSDMDRQLTALALGISTGSIYLFSDGNQANDWIIKFIQFNMDSFILDFKDYLSPMEIVLIKDALCLY